MRFIFDCEDEVCLPAAYRLVDEVKPFVDKMKAVEVDEDGSEKSRMTVFKKIMENMMVKYPAETGKLFSKLWVLEEISVPAVGIDGSPLFDDDGNRIYNRQMEKAPNVFKTMATLFSNEVAIDFFTSVLPSLLQISKEVSPLLTSEK